GTEYENTVRELLGVNVPLKELLPEENSVAGFDNVSAALDLSATHLLQYQEAAERAILASIPVHPPYPYSETRTGKQFSELGPNSRQTLGRSCMVKGDALVVFSKLPRYGLCSTSAVRADGRYKVTMSIAAVGAENKPVPVALSVLESQGREAPVVRELRD